jgi:hypothetical protein
VNFHLPVHSEATQVTVKTRVKNKPSMTRKEKIANNVEKAPKRKKAYAERLKAEKAKIAVSSLTLLTTHG